MTCIHQGGWIIPPQTSSQMICMPIKRDFHLDGWDHKWLQLSYRNIAPLNKSIDFQLYAQHLS